MRKKRVMSEEHKQKLQEGRSKKALSKLHIRKGYITKDTYGWTLTLTNAGILHYGSLERLMKSLPDEYLKSSELNSWEDVKKVLEKVHIDLEKIADIINCKEDKHGGTDI